MASLRHMIHQGNIAALQQAISRTLSETYEVDTALDLWMLKLLQQLEEDETGGYGGNETQARSSPQRSSRLSPTLHGPALSLRGTVAVG